jgi:DNA-binding response OmpR family regulator
LRRKLGDDAKSPRYIETVRSVGYRLKKPELE